LGYLYFEFVSSFGFEYSNLSYVNCLQLPDDH